MDKILVAGAGKTGAALACLLAHCGDYQVYLADSNFNGADFARMMAHMPEIKTIAMDFRDEAAVKQYLDKVPCTALISCLPAKLSYHAAKIAVENGLHFFDTSDLIPDIDAMKMLAAASDHAFVLHCGLVPGMVNMIAHHLMQDYSQCERLSLKVGFLPEDNANPFYMNSHCSSTRLIHQYSLPCTRITDDCIEEAMPLDDRETIMIEQTHYETFNAAGGLGNLLSLTEHRPRHLRYQAIHFPGHSEKMQVIFDDLKLHEDLDGLKTALKKVMPLSIEDKVIIHIQAEGLKHGQKEETRYLKILRPESIRGIHWSAAQYATAAGALAVVDMILAQKAEYRGWVLQENLHFPSLMNSRFGYYFD